MSDKPFAPATARNRHAILDVLRSELVNCESILEIGSGTGQHAVCFGAAMPHLIWQTSDMQENHAGIQAWLDDASLPNVVAPLLIDVRNAKVPTKKFDAVFSANTAHIMGFDAVKKMFSLVAATLCENGLFFLYGPFRQGGEFNTESNQAFDASLRSQHSEMGIRDLEALDELASSDDMHRQRLYAMPANNHLAVWQRQAR